MEHAEGPKTGAEVKLAHVAAESAPESAALNPHAELNRLREVRKKFGGQKMFQKDTHAGEHEHPVIDFAEMSRVRATITDPHHQVEYDRQVGNIHNLTSESEVPRPDAITDARPGFGKIEAFSDAVAMAINEPTLTANMVRNYLRRVPGALTGAPGTEAKIKEVLKYHLSRPEYKAKLEEVVAHITLPPDFETTQAQTEQLQELERQETAKIARKTALQAHIDVIETVGLGTYIPIHEQRRLSQTNEAVDSLVDQVKKTGAIGSDINPATLATARGALLAKQAVHQADIDAIVARVPLDKNRSGDEKKAINENKALVDAYNRLISNVDAARGFLNPADPREAVNLINVRKAEAARTEITKVEQELAKIHQEKAPLRGAQHKRERELLAYQHKLEKAIGTAAQGYWNDVLLEKAQTLADAEVKDTEEKAKESQDSAQTADTLLTTMLRESYLKRGRWFGRGKKDVTGIDKKWLKNMSNEVKRRGPADMAKLFIDHIEQAKNKMSREQQAQVEAMLVKVKDPATHAYKLSREQLEVLGATYMPQILGESWAFGNNVKFTQAEAEHVRNMYTEDFWDASIGKRTDKQKEADALFGKGVLRFGDEFQNDVKKLLSADNIKKNMPTLLKLAAVIGGGTILAAGGGPVLAAGLVNLGEAAVKITDHLVGEAGRTLQTVVDNTHIKLEQPGGPLEQIATGQTTIDNFGSQIAVTDTKIGVMSKSVMSGAQGVIDKAGEIASNVSQEAAKDVALISDAAIDKVGQIGQGVKQTVDTGVREFQAARQRP